jgi:16S rRNA (guanine527-N7)-methyltransferase
MGPAFDATLETGLKELGLSEGDAATSAARSSYEAHARLLADWNQAINLTAIREPADVARRHVIDSLSAAVPLGERLRPGASVLDLGSGCGYPGLPLAAALPLARVGLLDSVSKKARFLAVAGAAVAGALGDGGADRIQIEAMAERAEDLAEEPEQREAWDAVVARAVGSLAEVLELGLPLVREGGLVAAWKREDERHGLRAELRDAGSIARAAGGGRPRVVDVSSSGRPEHRLVLVIKERPTPIAYPRPASARRKRRR